MDWYENGELWDSLDDLILNMWPAMNRLLTEINNHRDEFSPHTQALLLGGIGRFTVTYVRARDDNLSEHVAYDLGMAAVVEDPRIQKMMMGVIKDTVDGGVDRMESDFHE